MKRFYLLSLLLLFSLLTFSQTNLFVCEKPYFEFRYPESYTKSKIASAPHMILKIKNSDEIIYNCSLSLWNYNLDEKADIWNEEFFSAILNEYKYNDKGSVMKTKLTINGTEVKSIEINSIKHLNVSGYKIPFTYYLVTYQVLYKGYLLVICMGSSKDFVYSLNARKQLLKGLKFIN